MQFILMCDDDVEDKLGEFAVLPVAKKTSSSSASSGDAGSDNTSSDDAGSGTAQVIKEAIKSKIGKLREGTKRTCCQSKENFILRESGCFSQYGKHPILQTLG